MDTVVALVAAGAVVNQTRTDDGCSPLYAAAINGHVEVVNTLIKSNVSLNQAWMHHGETPLYAAAKFGKIDIVQALIEAGAAIDQPATDTGMTPLDAAEFHGHEDVLRFLMASGGRSGLYAPQTHGHFTGMGMGWPRSPGTYVNPELIVHERQKFLPQHQQVSVSESSYAATATLGSKMKSMTLGPNVRQCQRSDSGRLVTLSSHTAFIGAEKIDLLIRERERARRNRNWSTGDAIREQLRAYGVQLFDRDREWRCTADGRRGVYDCTSDRLNSSTLYGGIGSRRTTTATAGLEVSGPTVSATGTDDECVITEPSSASDISVDEIRKKIAEREKARKKKEWVEADRIRDDLKSKGVDLFDKDKEWRSKFGVRGIITDRVLPCSLKDLDIVKLVALREKARMNKDFKTSDAIRKELRSAGVDLFDKQKCWKTVDGRSGIIIAEPGGTDSRSLQTDIKLLQDLLKQRENARMKRDWVTADLLRDKARSHGVEIYDKEKVWRASNGRCGVITRGQALSDEGITLLVEAREDCRQRKDWIKSDQIRNELTACGVQIVDSEKLWKTLDGRSGRISIATPLYSHTIDSKKSSVPKIHLQAPPDSAASRINK